MPEIKLTDRYRRSAVKVDDAEMVNNVRTYLTSKYKLTGKVKSVILTEGDPDGLGEINPDEFLVIQTTGTITEKQKAELLEQETQ